MTEFELEQRGAAIVVGLIGELDLTNAHELGETLENVSDASLVLDLTRVAFIDSAALHVLFRAARDFGKGRFGIAIDPASAISRTLAIVRISEVATVADSVDDVTAALAAT